LPTPAVTIDSLRFAWPGQAHSGLDIGHFELAPAERVFLRGPSGCGKSTLLGLIAGVLTAQSGRIEILGQSVDGLGGAARDRLRADHFGIIFQQFNLIPYLSVIENVTLPCHFSDRRARKARADGRTLQQEALRLLEHLDMAGQDVVDKPVTELSVGQQQRVAAARALIGAPEILIADEPTSSMDAERRQAFIELLFRECTATGSSLLFVSHDSSLREPFDRSIEFEQLNAAAGARWSPASTVTGSVT
jgi:putative ABC transport system ATP-binding protein